MIYKRQIIVGETDYLDEGLSHQVHQFGVELAVGDSIVLAIDVPTHIVPTIAHPWMKGFQFADGFDDQIVSDLYKAGRIWSKYHISRGTLAQMSVYAEVCERNRGQSVDRAEVLRLLDERGLMIDCGHKYDSCSYPLEPCEDLVSWLFSLPGTGHSWDDVKHIYAEPNFSGFDALLFACSSEVV